MQDINGIKVLNREDIEQTCPAFYATRPKYNVSDRYAFISTRDIALELVKHGWYPTQATESRSNKAENAGLNKHMVRWTNTAAPAALGLGNERIELVGVNSHNRSKAFSFYAGIFVLVCSNGLIIQSSEFGGFTIRHSGDIQDQVREAVLGISNFTTDLVQRMDQLKAVSMPRDAQFLFADGAFALMHPENEHKPAYAPRSLLRPRRMQDADPTDHSMAAPNLWKTMNVVQENLIAGGIKSYNPETQRRSTTRAVTSIDKKLKVNQNLWAFASKIAELKG